MANYENNENEQIYYYDAIDSLMCKDIQDTDKNIQQKLIVDYRIIDTLLINRRYNEMFETARAMIINNPKCITIIVGVPRLIYRVKDRQHRGQYDLIIELSKKLLIQNGVNKQKIIKMLNGLEK